MLISFGAAAATPDTRSAAAKADRLRLFIGSSHMS
jgi:hypothetical protein